MAGLITLNVALMPPFSGPFDLDGWNKQIATAIGYPTFAYWHLFADPEGPKIMEEHLESLYYALNQKSVTLMKDLWCTDDGIRRFIEADRKDVPLKPYVQGEAIKAAWIQSKSNPGDMVSQCCWYRAANEGFLDETEATLDGHVDQPYLFIGADEDVVCTTARIEYPKMLGLIKDLTFHEVHSGHWSPFEVPDEIGSIILKWLEKKGFSA